MQKPQVKSTQCRGTRGETASRGMGGSRRRGAESQIKHQSIDWLKLHQHSCRTQNALPLEVACKAFVRDKTGTGWGTVVTRRVANVTTVIICTESITEVKTCSNVRSASEERFATIIQKLLNETRRRDPSEVQENSSEKDCCTQHINRAQSCRSDLDSKAHGMFSGRWMLLHVNGMRRVVERADGCYRETCWYVLHTVKKRLLNLSTRVVRKRSWLYCIVQIISEGEKSTKSKAVCLVALLTTTWSSVVVSPAAAHRLIACEPLREAVMRSGRLTIAIAAGNDEIWRPRILQAGAHDLDGWYGRWLRTSNVFNEKPLKVLSRGGAREEHAWCLCEHDVYNAKVETGNECWLENYMSSHGNPCYDSLMHERVVPVKFIFGLVRNTLPAEHEIFTSIVGLWSRERSTWSTIRVTTLTWHRLSAHSSKSHSKCHPW